MFCIPRPLLVTGHAHVFPHDVTEFTMDIVNRAVTLDGEELVDAFFGLLLAVFERSVELLLMGVPHTVVWVGLYSGGNRLRLRLPLTSQNQAPLRGSCPLYDRSAIAPLSPTRLVNTSRFWLTGSLSLALRGSPPPLPLATQGTA